MNEYSVENERGEHNGYYIILITLPVYTQDEIVSIQVGYIIITKGLKTSNLDSITSYNKYYLHSYKNVQISYSNLMMKEEIRGTKASCYAVIMLSDLAGS